MLSWAFTPLSVFISLLVIPGASLALNLSIGLVIHIAKSKMLAAVGIRKKKVLSMRDFEAHDNAIDSAQLSRFENGEKVPMICTLYKIATVLEVDIADFFKSK